MDKIRPTFRAFWKLKHKDAGIENKDEIIDSLMIELLRLWNNPELDEQMKTIWAMVRPYAEDIPSADDQERWVALMNAAGSYCDAHEDFGEIVSEIIDYIDKEGRRIRKCSLTA